MNDNVYSLARALRKQDYSALPHFLKKKWRFEQASLAFLFRRSTLEKVTRLIFLMKPFRIFIKGLFSYVRTLNYGIGARRPLGQFGTALNELERSLGKS